MNIIFYGVYFLLPFIWWLFTARKNESFLNWIGLKRVIPKKSLYYLIVLNFILTYISPKYITPLFMPESLTVQTEYLGTGISALPSIIYFGLFQTGFCEEFFFRGFLLKRLQNKLGFIVGNTIHSIIFALPHCIPLIIMSFELWIPAIFIFIIVTLTAFMYGYISEKSSGGSIIPNILIHGFGNIAVSLLYAFNLF